MKNGAQRLKPALKRSISAALLLLGAALTTAGIFLGQPGGVMEKAVRVCLECIGIG